MAGPSYAGGVSAVGMVIGGRFRVDQLVGAGGMGVVVAATHLELGHRVAIKFLREEIATQPTVVERFLREARSVVQLRTEHVCRVIDVDRTERGAPYIVMELLEGSDLGRVVAKQPLPLTIAVEYVLQACVAIAEAHAAGIVHRDLKPANLFVTRRASGGPLVKVLDFGIAKAMTEVGAQLTKSNSMLGSPGYISPEQLSSARDVDVRTDIWALGATLYQLLSARLPFYRANAAEMVVRIVTDPPDPLDVDPRLCAVVFRCLAKSPEQRYGDVAALAAELAPFGGPSGRAIAAMVAAIARGAGSPAPPVAAVSPSAMTAASVIGSAVPSLMPLPTPMPSPFPMPTPMPFPMPSPSAPVPATPAYPRDATGPVGIPAPHRSTKWLVAALVGLAALVVALVYARPRSGTPTPGSAVAEVHPAAPADAAIAVVATPDAAPADAGPTAPAPVAGNRPKDPRPKTVRPKDPRPKAPPRVASTPAAPSAPPPASGSASGKSSSIVGTVMGSARETKSACFENVGDAPWKTAMCWCTKKDQARAQAAYAKLSGFKRTTVREYCAVRGINF